MREKLCLEREVTSRADGLFKLSINVSLKKDLNYINEFKSRADGGKLSPSYNWEQSKVYTKEQTLQWSWSWTLQR